MNYNKLNKNKSIESSNQKNVNNIQDILVKMATHYLNNVDEKEQKTG